MTDATKTLAIGRDLVSPELFGKLAGRIARNAHLDYEFAGRFIDHVPLDDPASGESARERVLRTVETIREAGFRVDDELWPMNNATCGNCQENGNCTASGPDGNDPGAH